MSRSVFAIWPVLQPIGLLAVLVRSGMLLVKLETSDPMAREDALRYINNQHGLILDIDDEYIIAEITGEPEELDQFLGYVRGIGIVEMSRTGVTAIEKGRLMLGE